MRIFKGNNVFVSLIILLLLVNITIFVIIYFQKRSMQNSFEKFSQTNTIYKSSKSMFEFLNKNMGMTKEQIKSMNELQDKLDSNNSKIELKIKENKLILLKLFLEKEKDQTIIDSLVRNFGVYNLELGNNYKQYYEKISGVINEEQKQRLKEYLKMMEVNKTQMTKRN